MKVIDREGMLFGRINIVDLLVVVVIVFIALWFLFFAEAITFWSQQAIALNNLTGIEAFLFNNLNMFVFIMSIITLIAGSYFASD